MSAQIGTLKNTVIPPSPTSGIFRQYVGLSPDLSTGAASFDLPLFEISIGAYTLPLTIKYHSNGIKVDDSPYPLGYGWLLTPGLRVTRTILGRSDFNYEKDIRQDEDSFDYLKKTIYTEEHGHHYIPDSSLVDTQYDIFTIHIPSGSFSFVVENVNGVFSAKSTNNNLKISFSSNQNCITIIDEKGITYYFGDDPESYAVTPYREYVNNNHGWPTAWLLRKIELPGGKEINFTWVSYTHNGISFGRTVGSDVIQDWKNSLWGSGTDYNPTYHSAQDLGILTDDYEYPYESHLSSITFPSGAISFSYDGANNPLIRRVIVTNNLGTIVKDVTLTYGSGLTAGLLQDVRISDLGKYTFTYDSHHFSNYYAQDWWGYCNGKPNRSLNPQMWINVYNSQYSSQTISNSYGQADRSVDTTYVKANILTRIDYPTGGFSQFEYEPHSFDAVTSTSPLLDQSRKRSLTMGAGVRVRKIISHSPQDNITIIRRYVYGDNGDGKANVVFAPTEETFIDEYYAYNFFPETVVPSRPERGNNFRLLYINPHSNYLQYNISAPILWYDYVTEYDSGGGKTEYEFGRISPEDEYYSYLVKDLWQKGIHKYNTLFSNGTLLLKMCTYEKVTDNTGSSYVLKSTVRNKYSNICEQEKRLTSLYVTRKGVSIMGNGPDFLFHTNGNVITPTAIVTEQPVCTYTRYPQLIDFNYEQLDSVVAVTYSGTDSLRKKDVFLYSNYLNYAVDSQSSDGHQSSKRTYYPADKSEAPVSQRAVLQNMEVKNMVSVPFKESTVIDGKNRSFRYDFSLFDSNNLYLPSRLYSQKGTGAEILLEEYDYDSSGNLRTLIRDGVEKTTYLWSYNHSFPAMQISGKSYAEVVNKAGSYNVSRIEADTGSSVEYYSDLIRNALDSTSLVTSYSYIPLVGISKVKDCRERNTSYIYDKSWRLRGITDNDGNYIARTDYSQVNDEPLSLTFQAGSSYPSNTGISFSAVSAGRPDNLEYQWVLKDNAGRTIYTSPKSESPAIVITFTSTGTRTLTCTGTNIFTGESASYSRSFTVISPAVSFSNISHSPGSVSAQIDPPVSTTLSFNLRYTLSPASSADVFVAGDYRQLTGSGSISIQRLVDERKYFSIDVTNCDSGCEVVLTITEATSCVVGTPNSIGIYGNSR